MVAIPKTKTEIFTPGLVPANDNSPGGGNSTRFRLMTYEEFKASRAYDTAAEAIKGLMRVGTLNSVNARPSKGKTGLTIEIGRLLSEGAPFLGRPTKPCNIAYIPVEDGNDVANRLHAIDSLSIRLVVSDEGFSLGGNFKQSVEDARAIVKALKDETPDKIPVLVIDTLRAALEGQSVLDDRHTSPPLNALRKVAEEEGAIIIILNHTNRDNPKNSKGETLESVVAMELILIEKEGDDWFHLWVGKNRYGRAHHLLGKLRFTSVENDDGSTAAVVESLLPATAEAETKATTERMKGDKKILYGIIQTAILESNRTHRPFGAEGPTVKVVDVEKVRPKFYDRKAGDKEARRRAFNRNLGYLIEDEYIVKGDVGNREVLWTASKEAESAGHFAKSADSQ